MELAAASIPEGERWKGSLTLRKFKEEEDKELTAMRAVSRSR